MFKNCLVLILVLLAGRGFAQQDCFVLIHSESRQPFYVMMGKKTYSSSLQGHLILSALKEGKYMFVIGSPTKVFPDQPFTITIKEKDLEFEFKNLGDKGWGLFNPRSLELVMPEKNEEHAGVGAEGVKRDDAFSRMMAGVVSDTAVMYTNYGLEPLAGNAPVGKAPGGAVKNVENFPVADSAAANVSGGVVDSLTVKSADSVAGVLVSRPASGKVDAGQESSGGIRTAVAKRVEVDTVTREGGLVGIDAAGKGDSLVVVGGGEAGAPKEEVARPVHKPGNVVKIGEHKGTRNWRGVYADKGSGKRADTIVVIIPTDTVIRVAKKEPVVSEAVPMAGKDIGGQRAEAVVGHKQEIAPAGKKDSGIAETLRPGEGEKKADGEKREVAAANPVRADSPRTADKKPASKVVLVNSDCKNFATDYDVDKLRIKMLEAAGKDEDRMGVARKVFKTKCFTTRQIKALSEVFTTDAAKFRFFETAYPFVSDDKFGELSGLLADPVYNSKFKAMTGQQ